QQYVGEHGGADRADVHVHQVAAGAGRRDQRLGRAEAEQAHEQIEIARVAAYNWGFVNGKSQTIDPWDSWQKTYTAEPPVWFHDIFRQDGSPFSPDEVALIRKLNGVSQ